MHTHLDWEFGAARTVDTFGTGRIGDLLCFFELGACRVRCCRLVHRGCSGLRARAIVAVSRGVHGCPRCGNYTEQSFCSICESPRRDTSVICVVEQAADIGAIERTGEYRGLYHVLGGRLSPLDGIGPAELNVASLLDRLGAESPVREVVLATNASVEGEATALCLHRLITPKGMKVTRLARGLPVGGDLEYADGVTIVEALHGRREL